MFSLIAEDATVRLDVLSNGVSCDATGNFAVLGMCHGRRKGLCIVDLEVPYQPPKLLPHNVGADVAKWNPHKSHCNYVASTSQRDIVIWNVDDEAEPILLTLKDHHIKNVSDVSWSTSHPNTFVSCSVHGFLHLWDLRTAKSPSRSFATDHGAGASKVAFARHKEFLVASAHDSELRIWDVRRGGPTDPVVLIPAHAQKIYGIDWSRNAATADQLLSCSQDRSVRFWSVSSPEAALSSISTPEPVYRASYAPFGNGVITVAARASNAIRLWHAGSNAAVEDGGCEPTLVQEFKGHTNVVKALDWRVGDDMNLGGSTAQIVSWSRDSHLRTWTVSQEAVDKCTPPCAIENKRSEESVRDNPAAAPGGAGAVHDATAVEEDGEWVANRQDRGMRSPDSFDGNRGRDHRDDTTWPSSMRGLLGEVSTAAEPHGVLEEGLPRPVPLPCPRLCGARFGANGALVVWSSCRRGDLASLLNPVPKTYEALKSRRRALATHARPPFFHARLGKDARGRRRVSEGVTLAEDVGSGPHVGHTSTAATELANSDVVSTTVYVYTVWRHLPLGSPTLPANLLELGALPQHLAEPATLAAKLARLPAVCQGNSARLASRGQHNAAKSWDLLSEMVKLVATGGNESCDTEQSVLVGNRSKQSLWERHPFGKSLLSKVVAFHEAQGDLDTLAALGTNMSPNVAVLHNNEPAAPVPTHAASLDQRWEELTSNAGVSAQENRSHAVHSVPAFEDYRSVLDITAVTLVHPALLSRLHRHALCFADILFAWGPQYRSYRASLLKFCRPKTAEPRLEVQVLCKSCKKPSSRPVCSRCHRVAARCDVCDVACKGIISFCPLCGHGGHTQHMVAWFQESDQCPTGCGCPCIEAGIQLAKDVETMELASGAAARPNHKTDRVSGLVADDDADFGDIL